MNDGYINVSISVSGAMCNGGAATSVRIGLATVIAIIIRVSTTAAGNIVLLKGIVAYIIDGPKVSRSAFTRRSHHKRQSFYLLVETLSS